MTKRNAVLLLLCSAVLWSTGGGLIKSIDWHPLAIAGARSAIASLVILLVLGRIKLTWRRSQLLAVCRTYPKHC